MTAGGVQIKTTDDPATALKVSPGLLLPGSVHHSIKPYPSIGNDKIGEKPFGILPAVYFCGRTHEYYDSYPFRVITFRVSIAPPWVAMDMKRMDLSAQRTPFSLKEEL
jgi:hypothetical protein